MITSNSVIITLREFLELLLTSDLALYVQWPKKISIGSTYRITWSSIKGSLIEGDFATIDEYGAFLKAGQYTAFLYDGAILQISYDFIGNKIVGHRLGYYPWPFFEYDKELLSECDPYEVFNMYISEKTICRLNSPIRFDYRQNGEAKQHARSHVHLNRHYTRIAVSKPLSLGQFVHFIFKNFYPDDWKIHRFLREKLPNMFGNNYLCLEENDALYLHIVCP